MKITVSVSACLLFFAASLVAASLQEQNKAIAKRAFEEILSQGNILLVRIRQCRSEKSFLLTGLRGVGKTVLLNEMERLAEKAGYENNFY